MDTIQEVNDLIKLCKNNDQKIILENYKKCSIKMKKINEMCDKVKIGKCKACSLCKINKYPEECCPCNNDDDLEYMYASYAANNVFEQIVPKKNDFDELESIISDIKINRSFHRYTSKQKQNRRKEHQQYKK